MYKIFYKKMASSTRSILALKTLIYELLETYQTFGFKLNNIAIKFHKDISNDLEDDPDEIVFINQLLSNYLLKMESEIKLF